MNDLHLDDSKPPKLHLPKGWPSIATQSILHVIAVARITMIHARNWPSECDELNLRATCDRFRTENSLLRRELAIKDARMRRIPPNRRPNYTSGERLEILMLKPACGLSNVKLADRFNVTAATIQNWFRRMRDGDPFISMPDKVTRYPLYLRYIVQQLKAMCPLLGKDKIADCLARTGLHLSASTVGRIINEPPISPEDAKASEDDPRGYGGIITKHPDRIWSIDLTEIPTSEGFWVPWRPFAISQRWPYCWHVLTVIDQHSRFCVGMNVFEKAPTRKEVTKALDQLFEKHGIKPQDIVLDRGTQFDCFGFKAWSRRRDIKLRYGKLHRHGSIAVTERFHRSLKDECTSKILVSTSRIEFEEELEYYRHWYNGFRPHMKLKGRTPQEAYFNMRAGNSKPRIEPRPGVDHRTPCASPRMMIAGKPGAKVRVKLSFYKDRRHLPIIEVVRA
jgi:putative transposase